MEFDTSKTCFMTPTIVLKMKRPAQIQHMRMLHLLRRLPLVDTRDTHARPLVSGITGYTARSLRRSIRWR